MKVAVHVPIELYEALKRKMELERPSLKSIDEFVSLLLTKEVYPIIDEKNLSEIFSEKEKDTLKKKFTEIGYW